MFIKKGVFVMAAFDFFKIPTEEENKKVEKFWEAVETEFAAGIGFGYEYSIWPETEKSAVIEKHNSEAKLCREWIAVKLQGLTELIDDDIIEMCYKTQEISPLARTFAKIFENQNEAFFKNNAFEFSCDDNGKVVCKAFTSEGA